MALPDILPDDVFAEDIESDAVKIHQWTREEYEQAAEAGLFKDRRVELVDGVVYDMPPQLSPRRPEASIAIDDLLPRHAAAS